MSRAEPVVMRKRQTWCTAGTMGLAALLVCSCGFSVGRQDQKAQFAAYHPAENSSDGFVVVPSTASGVVDLAVAAFQGTVTQARPIRSLLEMRHQDVIIQSWDLSCGAAALATLLKYEWGMPVAEKEVANGLMARREYIENPKLVQIREGFSLLDLKHYVEARGFKGDGLGQLDFSDLVENAPIMVPVNALGYNHFVIFRGVMRDRVLLADPAWGNRTMTADKFQHMWLDYGKEMGHVGFIVKRADGSAPISRLGPKSTDFVTFN
jgi:predicted double-glycine peptidase